jgi:hypothetical protein
MSTPNQADPIWGEIPKYYGDGQGDFIEVDSYRCGGRYRVAGSVLSELSSLPIGTKARLTTLILESNRLGEPLTITSQTLAQAADARALAVAERMDRMLLYFMQRGFRPGTSIMWLTTHSETEETRRSKFEAAAWIEAESMSEVPAFRDLLEGAGFLRHTGSAVHITAPGFARMDVLRRGGAPTRNAFVAMWFGEEMAAVYDDAIYPAIAETGFTPVRIDRKEHVNKIDDEIVAEIKRARFVFADFTSGVVETTDGPVPVPRGGVYYEAGLAQGREIPVIWSVREDQIEKVHFDTRQFNHITWKSADELKVKLTNRIRAIFAEAR